ncbi:MAG: diguanylate cyclase [Microcoleaceae cyanobacterium]
MESQTNRDLLVQTSFLALPPSASIQQAIEMMSEARESCVLIIENRKLLGIFTERDIVRITANNTLLQTQILAEVMTQKIITIQVSETQDIFTLSKLLTKNKIRHLPVLDDRGQLLGIITPQSIRKLLKPEYLLRYIRVADVMIRQVIHGLPNESVIMLSQKMADNRISCIVIIDHHTLTPMGIITERDIVRFHQMGLDLAQISAESVMSAPLSTMQPQDSLWNVNQRMHELGVRRLVISHPTGELAGIVTQSQMMKMLDPAEMYHVMEVMQEVIDRQTDELHQLNQKLQTANTELTYLSTVDHLTQVVNRRKFNEFLTQEWQRLSDLAKPLSLIMCDVDYFKSYNDTYGHLAGDKCLEKLARAIREVTRINLDLVARYGGEEFAVVLPNTNSVGAERVSKAIVMAIRDLKIPHTHSKATGFVTISLGVATLIPDASSSLETLLQFSDQLLYQAKRKGRNTYVIQDLTNNAILA